MEIPFEIIDCRDIFRGIAKQSVSLRSATPDRGGLLNAMNGHPRQYIFSLL
jgi:hypothetical protein